MIAQFRARVQEKLLAWVRRGRILKNLLSSPSPPSPKAPQAPCKFSVQAASNQYPAANICVAEKCDCHWILAVGYWILSHSPLSGATSPRQRPNLARRQAGQTSRRRRATSPRSGYRRFQTAYSLTVLPSGDRFLTFCPSWYATLPTVASGSRITQPPKT